MRPIQRIAAGNTLRILDEKRFDVVWSADDWNSTNTTMSSGLGSSGFSAEIPIGALGDGKLQWTLHWTEQNAWLGYNVEVQVDGQ
jgi:hypothetical protein